MAEIQVNRLTNANIYCDGISFLGKAEEISLPVIKGKMSEHKALGMIGAVEFISGFEKMEGKIKWNSFYEAVLKQAANMYKSVKLQIRANLEKYDASGKIADVAVKAFMTAQFKDFPGGNFKQNDNVEAESNLAITQYRLEIGNSEILEIDFMASIYVVDGVDLLANYRSNLGI